MLEAEELLLDSYPVTIIALLLKDGGSAGLNSLSLARKAEAEGGTNFDSVVEPGFNLGFLEGAASSRLEGAGRLLALG